jgi:PAS domain S-box-containing protein
MNLSRKIVLIIVSTFVALVCIVAATADHILLQSFLKIERGTVLNHAQQVRYMIKDRVEQVDVAARDFSEGMADLLQRGSTPQFITQHLINDNNLKRHRLDLAAMYDDNGRLILLRAIDCDKGVYRDIKPKERHDLDATFAALTMTVDSHYSGVVDIGGEAFMVSAQPVTSTEGRLRGFLLIGCFIDRDELEEILHVTGCSPTVASLAAGQMPQDMAVANAGIERGEEFVVRVLNDESVSGYFQLNGLSGKPSFIVKVIEKRMLFNQGKLSIAYVLSALIVSAAVFCGVMLLFIQGAVLKRLAALNVTVGEISRNRDISSRLDVRGGDELATLAGSINAMLDSLESAEQSLKESEERYRALFECAPDAILVIGLDGDEAGRVVAANQAAAEQHGYTVEEICGMKIFDLNTPETNAVAPEMIKEISGGSWITHEVWHIRKDGTHFPIEIHAGPFRIKGRNYILGFDRDITSRKLAEESTRTSLEQIQTLNAELARKAVDLELANKELETFNYSVSHDMRGPLTRISGYSQLLLDDDSGIDAQARTYVTRIYESICWLDEMINAMLSLAHLSRADFSPEPVDLTAICQEHFYGLSRGDQERIVEVIVAPGVAVVGDESLLKILMANLINNAWKYTSRTGQARIEFGVMTDGPDPVFFVRDNGTGFDMKDADKLFRVFSRLHDPTQFSGSGIGLATAHRIVTRHGGRMWAEGELGRGATFFFTLPPENRPV